MKHYGSVEITLKYKESWLYRRTYAYIAHHELGKNGMITFIDAKKLSTESIVHLLYCFSRA